MVKKKYCRRCKFRGKLQQIGFECNYCFLTGRTRLARTTPEQRAAGECPVWEEGKRQKGIPQKGLARDYPYKVDRVKLRMLYDRGLIDREIAKTAACSLDTVLKWRHAEELPANGKRGGAKKVRAQPNEMGVRAEGGTPE